MKLYSAKINLKGSLLNQVRKDHLTAAEIVLLRAVHGSDAVSDVKHTANVNRSDAAERARLARMYSITSPKGTKRGAELIREFLGIDSQPLPVEPPTVETGPVAENFAVAQEEAEEIIPVDAEPIKRVDLSARRKNTAAASAVAELTG